MLRRATAQSPVPRLSHGRDLVETGSLESLQILDIAFADFRLSVASIFVQNALSVPTGDLSNNTNNASGAMFSVVAVDEKRVVLTVENDTEDGFHRLDGNSFLLGTLHIEDYLANTFAGDECFQFMIQFVLLNQGAAKY